MNKFVLALLTICSASAWSEDAFLWAAFYSQSIVKTSNGLRLSGNSDRARGSSARAEMGVAASYEATPNIDVRGMVSVIRDGSLDGEPRVNYGLIDIHTDSGLHGIRLGRYSYEYGFYSSTRNNPFYRDLELPPQGLYRDGFKYMTRSGDGAQVYTKHYLSEEYAVEFDLGFGKPTLFPQQDIVQTFTLNKDAGKFTDDSTVRSFNATLDNRSNGWQVKYGLLIMDYRFSTPFIDQGQPFPMTVNNQYLGARKYFESGDLTVEYMKTHMGHTKWDDLAPMPEYQWGGVRGYSVTYKHYITSKLSGIIGYDTWYVNQSDKDGTKMQNASYGYTPASAMFHESINMGVVYREKSWSAKLEAHHVRGTNTVRADGNDIMSMQQPRQYNVVIATVTYMFH